MILSVFSIAKYSTEVAYIILLSHLMHMGQCIMGYHIARNFGGVTFCRFCLNRVLGKKIWRMAIAEVF